MGWVGWVGWVGCVGGVGGVSGVGGVGGKAGVGVQICYALLPESSDVYAFIRASLSLFFAGGFLHYLEQ